MRTFLKTLKRTELMWRYVSNLSPTLNYKLRRRPHLNDSEQSVLDALDRDGIAVTSIESLMGKCSGFTDLCSSVSNLLEGRGDEIEKLKRTAGIDTATGNKTFNLEILGSELTFDAQDQFALFALNEEFLRIADAYFRMVSKLRYYNVWYTAASGLPNRESQLWHYDREDHYILKVFLYLNDVGVGSGPFTYAPGTHRKGRHRSTCPEYFDEEGVRRTTDEQMANAYPKQNWKMCTGSKGTLIFADTRGYHKGGEARTDDRLMYTCMFTSPASQSKDLLHLPPVLDTGSLNAKQIEALRLK